MRILVISACVPFPPVGGGPLRTYHVLRALAACNDVTLLGFTFGAAPEPAPFPLRVITVPWTPPVLYDEMQGADPERSSRAVQILSSGAEPWFVSFYASHAMETAVQQLVTERFDLIWLEDSDMGRFLPWLPANVSKIIDFQNVYALMSRRAAEAAETGKRAVLMREADRTLRFEKHVAQNCDLGIVCSDLEATAAGELLGLSRIEVIPNGVDTAYFSTHNNEESPYSLLFTGTMNHPPNEEAVLYLVADILPKIREHFPAVELHVVGREPGTRIRSLATPNVVIHGAVADVRPYFAAASVVVAPILSGGGTRLKILEAAASSKAIVSTTFGAEGLGLTDNEHLLIGDSPEAFAQAVVDLLRQPSKRRLVGRRAREASLKFDWRHVEEKTAATVGSFSFKPERGVAGLRRK